MAAAACQQGVCSPGLHVYGRACGYDSGLCLGFLGYLCEPCGCMHITWWAGTALVKEYLAHRIRLASTQMRATFF